MQAQLSTWIQNIEHASDTLTLDQLKASLLGKSGEITVALKSLSTLSSIEEKKAKGAEINALRDALTTAFAAQSTRLQETETQNKLKAEALDVTLPSYANTSILGKAHPLTALKNDIADFFKKRGFTLSEGPEIEDEWHNFDALNIPSHHPARQNHDTFFIDNMPGHLLRTHTSTVQIRTLANKKPPLRIISMGRVYRSDDLDATHTPMFHQIEGLVLDKDINFGHLKGLIIEFCQSLFGIQDIPVRFRPSFFPFTEPSAEIDIACAKKDGKLVIGAGGDWMELLGCGMVHPSVLTNCDIDPNEYQGFAFGMGIERLCMIKNGITDIRQLYEGDDHWLKHFGANAF